MDAPKDQIDNALTRLASELAAREESNFKLQVTVPEEPMSLAEVTKLINEYAHQTASHIDKATEQHERRASELMQAYNALQSQTDDMNKELAMARRIQQRLLPQESDNPERPEMRSAGYYASMSNVGGDLYDLIRIGRNAYGILIADVSGHGVPSALITALAKISFRTKTHWGAQPSEVCRLVNEELNPILGDIDYFVTAFFAIIDLEQGTLRYTNCGHHPAILLRESADELIKLDSKGRFLGPFDDAEYEQGSLDLEPGDVLFLYTDGIPEARNLLDEEYTHERLFKYLESAGPVAPSLLVQGAYKDLDYFCMGSEQRDDLSMLAVQFLAPAPQHRSTDAAQTLDTVTNPATSAPMQPLNLEQQLAIALKVKNWDLVLSIIRTMDVCGLARAPHWFCLATIYYRAAKFAKATSLIERVLATSLDDADRAKFTALQAKINAAQE